MNYIYTCIYIYISVIRCALNVIHASFSPIFQYFSCYNNHVTGACTRHAPWIQPAMDSDSSAREAALHKKREGIKNIATVTVLKKERPDSLGADIQADVF